MAPSFDANTPASRARRAHFHSHRLNQLPIALFSSNFTLAFTSTTERIPLLRPIFHCTL
jgi:hypothetical protein